jgi:hypothetical protein
MDSNFEHTRFYYIRRSKNRVACLQENCLLVDRASPSLDCIVTGVPVRQSFMNDFDWSTEAGGTSRSFITDRVHPQ